MTIHVTDGITYVFGVENACVVGSTADSLEPGDEVRVSFYDLTQNYPPTYGNPVSITLLRSGGLAAAPQPVANCSSAPDLVYAIQKDQHTYKVEAFGPPGPHRAHAFLDESGEVVKNNTLLQELALGAWTKEMIVDRHDPRRTIAQVVAALSASNNLEGWEDATDVLARATVESIEAVATGGTSLNTAAQDLTLGVVERQLTNPKVALAHWAHAGLLESLNDYGQVEQHWPSEGTTVFQLPELEKIKSLYTEANMQFSVSEALVGAIAPTTWQDEFANYISSAVSELKPSLPSSATLLTLDNVLKLEELVAATGQSFNAYKQSLDLAQRVAAGDQHEISAWATEAAAVCSRNGAASTARNEPAADLSFERFYSMLRSAVDKRDSTSLRNLMAEKFQWAMDGYVSREKAFNNIGKIIGWENFWQEAQKATARNPLRCAPPYCDLRPGYHTWVKPPFPLEMMFEQLPGGEWRWTAVLGD